MLPLLENELNPHYLFKLHIACIAEGGEISKTAVPPEGRHTINHLGRQLLSRDWKGGVNERMSS